MSRDPSDPTTNPPADPVVHPTSIVHPGAQLGAGVRIGPFCVVGADVVLGEGCELRSHVNIEGYTLIGKNNQFFPFCSVGAPPQDLKHRGEKTLLQLGDNNIIRESATLQPGTVPGGGKTLIGSGNLFMAYSHVAHDCFIGNENILANAVQLSGHVTIEDQAVLGGMSAIHQFCRISTLAMLGGGSMVVKDVPPFALIQGDHACYRGLNIVGLRRRGYGKAAIDTIKAVYQALVVSPAATVEESIATLTLPSEPDLKQLVEKIVEFYRSSQRGVVRKHDRD